jgi:hypothetical protein
MGQLGLDHTALFTMDSLPRGILPQLAQDSSAELSRGIATKGTALGHSYAHSNVLGPIFSRRFSNKPQYTGRE